MKLKRYRIQVAHKVYEVFTFSEEMAIVLGQAEAIKDALADWKNAIVVK